MKIQISQKDIPSERILYHSSELELHPGISIIVGRNGAGKTSLLQALERKSPDLYHFKSYDNYSEGGYKASERYGFYGDMEKLAQSLFGSEGEKIFNNFCNFCQELGAFIKKCQDSLPIIVAIDAMDSGLDIDGTEQLKEAMQFIIKQEPTKEIYFLVTANNYALVEGMNCLDVYDFSYKTFNDFTEYKNFILQQYQRDRDNM